MKARQWTGIAVILIVTAALSGCIGAIAMKKTPDEGFMNADGTLCMPDNCTKCHKAWAEKFEYYRGWDRYGYFFGEKNSAGFYDPWTRPDVTNMYEVYYATDWWESTDLYVWPENIAETARGMSILEQPGALPDIPTSRKDIDGPVIVVAKNGGDYNTITQAVKQADAGTTVFVRPSEYEECVELKNGVNLIGEDPVTTIINPHNAGHAVIAANNSIIAGLTLTGTGIDYESRRFNCAVYVSGCDSTCVIARNIFRENGMFGVWIDGTEVERINKKQDKQYGPKMIEVIDREYKDYPNPVIVGNTFYRIGQRAVFCVHGRGEVFNNIFSGNVKAMGMERHSRPFVHHNVFFMNNVPMAVNRSEPVVCNNIFLKNQWGQRMLRGANPVIFGNVNYNSPFFRDFDEMGLPAAYETVPGTGERAMAPKFADPFAGDFSFADDSPLKDETLGFDAVGIMRDADLPQPLQVKCRNSWGREVLHMTDDIVRLIEILDEENRKLHRLEAAYTVSYENYSEITPDTYGDPAETVVTDPSNPVVAIEYTVPHFETRGRTRLKEYTERCTMNGTTTEDSGVIRFNGSCLDAEGGRFAEYYDGTADPLFIGERPFREAPGGFYRDYDQYIFGALGATGTNIIGYLRIMGGVISEETVAVDGHQCYEVRYPHIGKDQYFLYYLDPEIGWRPRKMEQYYNESLYRQIDSYEYADCGEGIYLPVSVQVNDFAVFGESIGNPVAKWSLDVDETSLKVNGRSI